MGNLIGDGKQDTPPSPYEPIVTSHGDDCEIVDPIGVRAKISEVEEEMQTFAEETITSTQFFEMEGNLNKKTGEGLTFFEAIRQGKTGSRKEYFFVPSASINSKNEARLENLTFAPI
ncbi:hypothetical protein CRE_22630 [Caenorhabditis remanei]|uniref:Uncharacterized protein n=1 Tax=Caenorhabditis remanei TaxID=31234 RepID=E3N8N3_CAERE|nr:hypothetical protein CRE_22630 [Caenorhabditis remanei]